MNIRRTVRFLGKAWLTLALALIVLGYVGIAIFDGLARLSEIASPFNYINTISIIVTLLPGYGLLKLADRLDARAQ